MGKASKFFKSLFSFKASDTTHHQPSSRPDLNKQPKRRWSFIKSNKDQLQHHFSDTDTFNPPLSRPRDTPLHHQSCYQTAGDDEKTRKTSHAIAVDADTAAAADAAVFSADAAAEVVRMTTRATARYGFRGEWAALKIQTYFRGYLARKALRALKALVKLQALVRGHILRKQAAVDFRRLQALLRVQARARAGRFPIIDSPHSSAKGPPTPEKFEHVVRTRTKHDQPSILKNNVYKSYSDERILEMDTVKHHLLPPRRRSLFHSQSQSLTNSQGSTIHPSGFGFSPSGSCEVNSITTPFEEEVSFCIPQNSPTICSKVNSSMKVGPFTPAKSDSSRSCLSGYSDHPNYMAYTESSRAKVRSVSAPRQRPHIEVSNTMKRYSVYGYVAGPGLGPGPQHSSNLRDSFVSKAYPGSGRLDRLGMPVGGLGIRESEFSGSYWNY
ncbi:unnamed protein product [Lactuca saligna]|uniref:DUF4005 domain-containing protein n=1 Tax=Lactuca saligna TaxID=75948 RepID=A0AA35VGZ4_LACSI|nr:unnamed protein product [Lactuca saligna]